MVADVLRRTCDVASIVAFSACDDADAILEVAVSVDKIATLTRATTAGLAIPHATMTVQPLPSLGSFPQRWSSILAALE